MEKPGDCQQCGTEFMADRSSARFCSRACAQAAREATVTRECAWPPCKDKARYGLEFCGMHYRRWKYGTPDMDAPKRGRDIKPCSVEGCGRKHFANGYCQMHDDRVRAHGEPGTAELRRAANGKGWTTAQGYRARRLGGRGAPTVLEHREVMEQMIGRSLLPEETVHHLNGIRHDNRPENLELWATTHKSGQRVADLIAFVAGHYPEDTARFLVANHREAVHAAFIEGSTEGITDGRVEV